MCLPRPVWAVISLDMCLPRPVWAVISLDMCLPRPVWAVISLDMCLPRPVWAVISLDMCLPRPVWAVMYWLRSIALSRITSCYKDTTIHKEFPHYWKQIVSMRMLQHVH